MNDLNLNNCGCCEGLDVATPAVISNPPGSPAIAYRVGTYLSFKQSMLARLSATDLPALSGPTGLGTRSNEDFSIALFDAWAVAADVLTFYQERIANESYVRTASERTSFIQIAGLVSYSLQPGVAAKCAALGSHDVIVADGVVAPARRAGARDGHRGGPR